MTFPKLVLALAFLMSSALQGQEAKLTDLMSKDLTNLPGKEGLMMIVDYPPGSVDPIHRHNAKCVYLCAGGLDRDASERRERGDFDTWSDLL
jgi:hypothetical protein